MDDATRRRIASEAKRLRRELWDRRDSLWSTAPRGGFDLLPMSIEKIASILGLCLEEPEEIEPDSSEVQTAGLLDRREGRIVIAQKFRPEWRRFTGAHEVGHYVLHADVISHRDRPLNGGERANVTGRSVSEQEADLFAAQLLMPPHLLREAFRRRFGRAIDLHEIDQNFCAAVSGERQILIDDVQRRGRRGLALLLAGVTRFGNPHFIDLAGEFGVSQTAMAIELDEQGLVR